MLSTIKGRDSRRGVLRYDRARMCKIYMLGICLCVVMTTAFVGQGYQKSRNSHMKLRVTDSRMAAAMPLGAMVDVGSTGEVSPFQGVVVFLCAAIPVAYWWYVIVPFKRRELATSKARGEMKEYLQELSVTPQDERKQEKWFYDKYLRQGKFLEPRSSDGLTDVVQVVEDELQQALPGGGFWSFDNPIFVCLVMLGLFCAQQVLFHDIFQN